MSLISVQGEQSTSTEIAKLTELNNLGDPNADRVLIWDDSAGSLAWATPGTGIRITGTTLETIITVSATAPSNPQVNDLWVDTS